MITPLLKVVETYTPFPRQAEFHRSPAKYRLFGGAAGPGKTAALVWEAVMQNLEVERSTVLLLRRTLGQLEDSLLKEFHKSVPWRDIGARYNDQKHRVFWPNGSVLRFGYCEAENDVYQYQGAEFLFIGLDELTHFTLKQWQFLTSRNRHPGCFATMAGATNPGNIGHAWVKALWIDKVPAPGMDEPEKYDRQDYDFIRALIADNPIYANDRNYLKTLDGLGKALRTAMLEGLWDQFAGQFFDIFHRDRHVGEWQGSDLIAKVLDREGKQTGTKGYRLQPWWPRWISIDWGFEHDFAVYWHTTADDGRHITYREWVDHKLSPRMLAQGIVERSVGEKYQQCFLGPDAFAHRTAEASIAEQLTEVLCTNDKIPRPAEAADDRLGGWQLLYRLLESEQWLISANCAKLIETLPQLIHDEKKVEDVKKVDGDDPADSTRYGLYSRLGSVIAPVEVRKEQALAKAANPTARAILAERFDETERKRTQAQRLVHPRRRY